LKYATLGIENIESLPGPPPRTDASSNLETAYFLERDIEEEENSEAL
jgi:hypothetical protein